MNRMERAELERALARDRERASDELARIRKKSDEEIARIRAAAEAREREFMAQLSDLENRQREAQRRMKADLAESLRKQANEMRIQISRIREEAQQRIRENAERMRREWERVTRELNDRIELMIQQDREKLEQERVGAKQALERARRGIQAVQNDSAALRFNGHMLPWLRDMFNSAVDEYNGGRFVQAFGKASLVSAECQSCLMDARNEEKLWKRNSAEAFCLLKQCRDALAEMDRPQDIEAADYVLRDVLLRAWNQSGWDRLCKWLDEIGRQLDRTEPCTGDEIAKYMTLMDDIERQIPVEIQKAQAAVVSFLYINYLLDYLCDTLCDWLEGWEPAMMQVEQVANRANAELVARDSAGMITLALGELGQRGGLYVLVEDGSFSSREDRAAMLEKLAETFKTMFNGEDELKLRVGEYGLFDNDMKVCMRIVLYIPDEAMRSELEGGGVLFGGNAADGMPEQLAMPESNNLTMKSREEWKK